MFIKDDCSSELTVTSGGLQCSVFAVFMFAVYINDLRSLMQNSTIVTNNLKWDSHINQRLS